MTHRGSGERAQEIPGLVISEIELLLAEKRTSLSMLRTGIAVLALPLSAMSALIATSRYYDIRKVLHFLIPVTAINLALVFFGGYLIVRSMRKVARYDAVIRDLRRRHRVLAEMVD